MTVIILKAAVRTASAVLVLWPAMLSVPAHPQHFKELETQHDEDKKHLDEAGIPH